ncbi:MAG: hypothetical protein FJ090_15305 [Deltaproteobacteria bacterium]|nr:hypothetical protein [Deltaproteobacteria bacterium]
MRDPAGICGRVPELIALAEAHPAAKRAIATGDPHAVYRALRAIRPRSGEEERETVEMLLSRRALFLRPLGTPPSMHTVSGIGTSLHGREEFDGEAGTYVATHCLAVFSVPVLPLGQYLVSDAGPSTFVFYGRPPETALVRAWRRAAWAIAALLLGSATWAGLEACAHAKVDVFTPLDAPMGATIDGRSGMIAPGGDGGWRACVAGLSAGAAERLSGRLAKLCQREYAGGQGAGRYFGRLLPAEKAACRLACSRQPSLQPGEAERLRREAEASDPLQGLVSHVAYRWPP